MRLDHDGHIIGEDVYGTYKHIKKLSEEDEEYAKELINNAKKKEIAPYVAMVLY